MRTNLLSRDVVFLAIGATALALSSAYVWAEREPQVQVLEEVQTPDAWVPFSAVMTNVEPGDRDDVSGRFFRAADGSTRIESGPPGRRQAVIGINNVRELKAYIYSEQLGWYSMPLKDGSVKPPRFRVDNVRWFRHPDKIEGLDLLRWVDPKGNVLLHAPALNGEVIVRQQLDGARRALSQIKVGEQPIELFEPPPGAEIRAMSQDLQDRLNNPERFMR